MQQVSVCLITRSLRRDMKRRVSWSALKAKGMVIKIWRRSFRRSYHIAWRARPTFQRPDRPTAPWAAHKQYQYCLPVGWVNVRIYHEIWRGSVGPRRADGVICSSFMCHGQCARKLRPRARQTTIRSRIMITNAAPMTLGTLQ